MVKEINAPFMNCMAVRLTCQYTHVAGSPFIFSTSEHSNCEKTGQYVQTSSEKGAGLKFKD